MVVKRPVTCYHGYVARPELVDLMDKNQFVQQVSTSGLVLGGSVAQDLERETADAAGHSYPGRRGRRRALRVHSWPARGSLHVFNNIGEYGPHLFHWRYMGQFVTYTEKMHERR